MDFAYYGSICSDLGLVEEFVEKTLKPLKDIIKNKDIMFDLRLILSELIINGVFHGNECIDTKSVELSLRIKDDKVEIRVEDEGEGIDYNFAEYNPLDLQCSGRGLIIVRGLSDQLIVEDNSITAIKNL